jgi:hypothetical protein
MAKRLNHTNGYSNLTKVNLTEVNLIASTLLEWGLLSCTLLLFELFYVENSCTKVQNFGYAQEEEGRQN